MSQETSRRDLLKLAGAAGITLAMPLAARAEQTGTRKKGDKLRVACIGIGGRGGANLASAAKLGDVIALCDVDADRRAKALMEYPRATTFTDFRELLEKLDKDLDVVIVSTPDHTHAPAAAMAMKLGKHVYCEKPLTRTIFEARRLAELAKKHRVHTQMGNQSTSDDSVRQVANLIRSEAFGEVKEIHCWTNRAGNFWPQGISRPAPKEQPKQVDFDLWLGPSPERPYAEGYHPFAWRGWWEFGSGALGDIGCHNMNLPFMALDLNNPVAVQAETSGHNKDSYPLWSIVKYEFAANRNRPAVNLQWYDGGKLPAQELAPGVKFGQNGMIIVCEKATLVCGNEYGIRTTILGGAPLPSVEFVKSPGHMAELFLAAEGGPAPMSNIPNYSGPLTEMVLLGNLAVWANGPRLEYDAKKMAVKGTNEYDALIKPPYRAGWTL